MNNADLIAMLALLGMFALMGICVTQVVVHQERLCDESEEIRGLIKEDDEMDRDCEHCARNIGGKGCTSWDCDYISSRDAIEAYEERRDKERRDKAAAAEE